MVKPGVYSVDKQKVDLKNGETTVEYVHVQVKSADKKPTTSAKGCTFGRVVMFVMVVAVLAGIAVGVAYAIKWNMEQNEPCSLPEGGDVIYPDPGDYDDHPGDRSTERPPPIDYIGTRPPRHPTQPTRRATRPPHRPTRPPRTPPPHNGRPRTRLPDDPTRHPRTRLPYDPTRPPHHHPPHHPTGPPPTRPPVGLTGAPHRPPHHRPPHHPPHNPPHDSPDNTTPHQPRDQDGDDYGHPRRDHQQAYRGISAWRIDQAKRKQRINEEGMRQMNQRPPPAVGRSRVQLEEERYGYDYGHSVREPPQKARQ